jgi:peroxiredoxin
MSLPLGEQAPDFRLTGIDGGDHALADYGDAELLVLVQSCNHCPYVLAWEGRLVAISDDYKARGVRIVAFNSNDAARYPTDSFDAMVEHAAGAGYSFDYLHDPEQSLARALGAERTPEAFVFDRDRNLVYHGAIDDSRDEHAVTARYLRDALDAALAGEPVTVTETPAPGCSVKWL